MPEEIIHVERKDRVAILRTDRPPANALDLSLATQLETAMAYLENDENIGAVILTGTGRFFSAGLDLKVVPFYGVEEQKALILAVNRLIYRLYAFPRPTIAAVNGHAVAGGLVTVLACDYRVGTDAACQLGLTESRVGIPYPVAAMEVVKAELAPAAARRWVLVGHNSGPEEARACGILDELQPPDRVLPRVREVAADLAALPRTAYARIKRQLRAGALARMEETIARQSDPLLDAWLTPESASASAEILTRKRPAE